jgi:hypothetical protein
MLLLLVAATTVLLGQQRNYDPSPMLIDVGNFNMVMSKLNGEGGLQSQFS